MVFQLDNRILEGNDIDTIYDELSLIRISDITVEVKDQLIFIFNNVDSHKLLYKIALIFADLAD
ncbi:MAG TPA: hypothetical protein VGM30_10830 [Puia sp.]|jgi:hypothetical protein